MATITYSGRLVTETCWCGIWHAIPEELERQARENGKGVFCPLGHTWVFKETDAQKERRARQQAEEQLARERARLDQERARVATLKRSRSALKGEVTKARKRAAATLCPVGDCHRSISPSAMRRHIEAKHPDWQPEPHLADA